MKRARPDSGTKADLRSYARLVFTLVSTVALAVLLLGACGTQGSGPTDPPFEWAEWEDCAADPGVDSAHPRPGLRRRVCLRLDGAWDFQLDPEDLGLEEGWAAPGVSFSGSIRVPFPWTSALSGVEEDTGDEGGVGWYRRSFVVVPALLQSGLRLHLVIGAADWHTTLFVNGDELASHDNGYLPMRVDVTDALRPGTNELVLRVEDPGNDAEVPHGKQGSPWYQNVAGLWQPVYLELAGETSIERLTMLPRPEAVGRFSVEADLEGPTRGCVLRLYADGQEGESPLARWKVAGSRIRGEVDLPWLTPWSPADPRLAWVEARLRCPRGEDALRTRVGWRVVGRGEVPGQTFESILLNGEPTFVRGALVQGFNPWGLYTYPDRQLIGADLSAAREAGYNLVRLHIKVEDPWVLHLADELGMLVSYDVPCHGIFPFASGDSPESRRRWLETMEGMILRDANHPSVIWWTLWNEDWGLAGMDGEFDADRQAFVKETLARAKALDPSRLLEDHSTLRMDHVSQTDINSFHLYGSDPRSFEDKVADWAANAFPGSGHNFLPGEAQDGAPLVNTEYGPFSFELLPEWQTDRDVSWGLRVLTGILRRHPPLVGYVFTQLYDVEFEHNGLLDYDRTPKDMGYPEPVTLAALNGADFVGFEEPWFQVGEGEPLAVTPFVTRWSAAPIGGAERVRLTLQGGRGEALGALGELPVSEARYSVESLGPVEVPLPVGFSGPAWVLAEWLDGDDNLLASNYLPGEVVPSASPSPSCDADHCAIPLDLASCAGDLDPGTLAEVDGELQAVGFLGEGGLECPISIPEELRDATALVVVFEGELAANLRGAPQTTASAQGGELRVAFAGQDLGLFALPPDRADSRGILGHLNGPSPAGGYGAWLSGGYVTLAAPPGESAFLSFTASGPGANGLVIYGHRLGRYGEAPALKLYR
ncbi:MAG: glycoside hydrolase family 2 TIM barrel-domain containing protein [Polyangia bacterium]|nr:glycoside hydrolase family 2 TIM barrel-domain containing protein [Polyangia bacterium]